ncbi:hypothetical protein [Shouchella patagoniensis]|uniref:hypothetical protein n=1 Tax=Shouchella patagoniensis TaxID=228576 RepID=UPI0014767728|nr:hypothetical protein [Shouchella patagoniensis]
MSQKRVNVRKAIRKEKVIAIFIMIFLVSVFIIRVIEAPENRQNNPIADFISDKIP